MAILQYPQVNGFKTSFCSIEMRINGGLQLPGLKSINYKESLTQGKVYGNSPFKQGRTRGQIDGTGSIEVYQDQWYAFLDTVTLGGTRGFSEGSDAVVVTFAEPMSPIETKTDILPGVRFHSPDFSSSEGTEALTVKVEFDILGPIVWNGTSAARFALSPANMVR